MDKQSILPRLDDILESIEGVAGIVAGLDFEAYQRSFVSRKAVERCVEIVSEASRYLPAELTNSHPDIPWHDIRGIGNRLRHEYQRVDDRIIWLVATKSLPELAPVIRNLIAQMDANEPQQAKDQEPKP